MTEMSSQTAGRLEQLLSPESAEKDKPSISMSKYHTFVILLVRIMADFVFKNPLLFLENYSTYLNLKQTQFSFVLIWTNIGCIIAVIIGEFNERLLKSYQNIMSVHLTIAAIGTALFIVPSFYETHTNGIFTIVWCSVCRFIVGVSFAFVSASSIKLATTNISSSGELSNTIAILHLSWALSTVLNIPCGYILEYISWRLVFIAMGVLLFLSAVLIKVIFTNRYQDNGIEVKVNTNEDYHLHQDQDVDDVEHQDESGLCTLLCHKNSLLILITSFSNGIRSISLYIVAASLWMEDIFHLAEYLVGWSTLTQIVGEMCAVALISLFAYKYKLWKLACSTLVLQYLSNGVLVILSAIYGNSVNGLKVALIIVFALVLSHQSFYVVSQSNSVQYAPSVKLSFLLLMLQRMTQEAASVLAIIITPIMWKRYDTHSIFIFSLLWSGCTVITSSIMGIYRSDPLDYVHV